MSGFNPFRPRSDGDAASRIPPTHNPNNLTPVGPALSAQPTSSQTPNGIPRKSSASLDLEVDDSTTSDEQLAADPFHSDSSQSDADADDEDGRGNAARPYLEGDRPREAFGSAPPQAPSADGSTATPFAATAVGAGTADQDSYHTRTHLKGRASSENDVHRALPASRARNKENKPPPPPRSHHGKRISHTDTTASLSSQSVPSQSTNRTSFHASAPESLSSSRTPTSYSQTSSHPPASEYVWALSESQDATESTDSLRRSNSQNRRPPTPPASRRHSQMRRSKSTQSKSSASRLTISSVDSDSTSSLPPSPGPPSRSYTSSSLSQDRKRVSMPPTASSSGDLAAVGALTREPEHSSSPANSRTTSLTGRRASSHGSLLAGASSVAPPPPPPPPRRGRDSNTRSSYEGSASRPSTQEPLPQPSNAQDILANLSQLQKEVDDLRGHYESRQVGS